MIVDIRQIFSGMSELTDIVITLLCMVMVIVMHHHRRDIDCIIVALLRDILGVMRRFFKYFLDLLLDVWLRDISHLDNIRTNSMI